jgi:hypothetical protein
VSAPQLDRDSDGKLPKFSSVGCYPLFYLSKQGNVLCADCANSDKGGDDDPPVAQDANWEDPDLFCDDCSTRIESAYADE